MTGPRDRKDSGGFEDLADELAEWDATFDSLHEEDIGHEDVLAEARRARDTIEPRPAADSRAPDGSSDGIVTASVNDTLDSSVDTVDRDDTGDEDTPTPGEDDEFVFAPIGRPLTNSGGEHEYEYVFDDDEVEISIVDSDTQSQRDELLFPTIATDPGGPLTHQELGTDIAIGHSNPFAEPGDELPPSPFESHWGGEHDRGAASRAFEDRAPRGPAIVRRDQLERRRSGLPELEDEAANEWDAPVTTNVMAQATVDKMIESAAAFFEDESDLAEVEFQLDDEFYDDIEIDESAADKTAASAISTAPIATGPTPGPARQLAHVVRRNPTPELEPARVVQLEIDDEGAAAGIYTGDRDDPASLEAMFAADRVINELESELEGTIDADALVIESEEPGDLDGAFEPELAAALGESFGRSPFAEPDEDDAELDAVLEAVVGPRRAPSVLTQLIVDVPPQLPPPAVSSGGGDPLASLQLVLPEHAAPPDNPPMVALDSLAADLEVAVSGVGSLARGPQRAALNDWAAGLALALGDLKGAEQHAEAAASDRGGEESAARGEARRERQLAARRADWDRYADAIETAAASAGESRAAGYVSLGADIAAALGRTVPSPSSEAGAGRATDIGTMFRSAISAARGGDADALARHFHDLAESVADNKLRVALVSAWLRAASRHSQRASAGNVTPETLAAALALAPEVSGDLVMWQLSVAADGASRIETARRLAEGAADAADPVLADSFRIIAGQLAIAAGDRGAGLRDLASAAAQRATHPSVARPLLEDLATCAAMDEELANYLVAVASGGPLAPVAARALRRWAAGAEGAVRADRLRRALALNPGDALTIAMLERPDESAGDESGSAEAEAVVGLALAPSRESDIVDILNRARSAHQSGDIERRDQLLSQSEVPVDRLLVAGELLGYSQHKEDAAMLSEAATGATRAVLARVSAVASGDAITASWSAPHLASELAASAGRGDRLAQRIRLGSAGAIEELWSASEGWPEAGGRVQLALARLATMVADGKLSGEVATTALAMVDELHDPRVRWLAAVALGRSGDWQRAADHLVADLTGTGDERGAAARYRAAYLLLEHADDATAAEAMLAPLLEEREPPVAVVELANAARRHLGVLAPEAARTDSGAPTAASGDPFARAIRSAEAHELGGDWARAITQYTTALALRPADPIARAGIYWVSAAASDAAPAAELALADLRAAEEERDGGGRADAYEQLARIDDEISGDSASALLAWESAADSDPMRTSALRALEVAYIIEQRHRDLLKVYGRLLAVVDEPLEVAALRIARARVAELSDRDAGEVLADWTATYDLDPTERMALFKIEASARGPETANVASVERADVEAQVAEMLAADPRSKAAFLCRAAETLASLGDHQAAIARYREAATARPGHLPSLEGWRDAAWRVERWDEFCAACQLESQVRASDETRAELLHLGGVALMDKAMDGAGATVVLEHALAVGGVSTTVGEDAFARLWQLFDERGEDERLGDLLRARLETATEPEVLLRLHLELAGLCRNYWNDREGACQHLRYALEIEPLHRGAVGDLADIAWELGAWDVAAETLLSRAKLETSPRVLKQIFYRLGTIYADHLPDPSWAIKCFRTALSHDPTDTDTLERLASLARLVGDDKMALGVLERLLKLDITDETKVRYLHEVAEIQGNRGKTAAAERAVRVAFDLAPHSRTALGVLLKFYQSAGDISSVRVNLDRAAQSMRGRLSARLDDTQALAVIARVLTVRERARVPGSLAVAQVAAELARAMGEESEEVRDIALGRDAHRPRLLALSRLDLDDLLAPRRIPAGLRVILRALRERIGKFVGADPKRFGVARGDRLKRGKHPIATLANEMAAELGVRGADIYVSSAALGAAIAVATTPTSVILGSRFASLDRAPELTFALGRALKLGQMGLALVDTMTSDELDLFVAGIIRQFAPEWPGFGQTPDALTAEQHRLRRLIPGSMMSELHHHALALTGAGLTPGSLHRAIRQLGLRAGLIATTNAAGALAAVLRLGGHSSVQEAAKDDDVVGLIRFSVSEEHVEIQAAMHEEPS